MVFQTTVFLSAGSILRIQKGYRTTVETLEDSSEIPPLIFSKEGKNVVVLMADALVSYYIPYMMQEQPELLDRPLNEKLSDELWQKINMK